MRRNREARQREIFLGHVARALQKGPRFAVMVREESSEIMAMISEGRVLWLTPLEWSMLLVSAALCGCMTLLSA